MSDTTYNFYLVADTKNTGITDANVAHEVLVQLANAKSAKEFICFWGCYGQPLSQDPKDEEKYVKVNDSTWYLKETAFTPATGYEKVIFTEAIDKSVYHVSSKEVIQPGDSGLSFATSTMGAEGDAGLIPDATKLVLTYKNVDDDMIYTEEWTKSSNPDDPDQPSTSDKTISASADGDVYILYCRQAGTKDDNYYAFAMQELKAGVYVWTRKHRLNIFNADYTTTTETFTPNGYTLSQVDKELNGNYPGLD